MPRLARALAQREVGQGEEQRGEAQGGSDGYGPRQRQAEGGEHSGQAWREGQADHGEQDLLAEELVRRDAQDGELARRGTQAGPPAAAGEHGSPEPVLEAARGDAGGGGPLPGEAFQGGTEVRSRGHELCHDDGDAGARQGTEQEYRHDDRCHPAPPAGRDRVVGGRKRGVGSPRVMPRSHSRQPM